MNVAPLNLQKLQTSKSGRNYIGKDMGMTLLLRRKESGPTGVRKRF
jgi:hypothetical protein